MRNTQHTSGEEHTANFIASTVVKEVQNNPNMKLSQISSMISQKVEDFVSARKGMKLDDDIVLRINDLVITKYQETVRGIIESKNTEPAKAA